MNSVLQIKACQMIGNKVLLIFELKDSQGYWGQTLTVHLMGTELIVDVSYAIKASVAIPSFPYDTQFLAKPVVIEFVNGNIGLGYWLNRTQAMVKGAEFEANVTTRNPTLYEDFIKSKVETINSQEDERMGGNESTFIKGKSFDVFPDASKERYLFDYYLYDINTDEVIETGALIAAGDTLEEATRAIVTKMQAKMADKAGSKDIKVHLNFIKHFEKPKPDDDTVTKMSDAIASAIGQFMKK